MGNITFKQYRNIDLFILSILLVISEGLTTLATTRWFVGVPFAISTTLLLICITMMRWGAFAAIPAVVGGLVFTVASGGELRHYLIYGVGNLFCLLSLILIRAFGKEKIRARIPLLLLFTAVTYLSVALGRWLVSLIFEPGFGSLLVYITTDVVTLIFTSVIVILMRKVDGMLEDQRAYLIRRAEEEAAEMRPTDGDDLSALTADPDYLEGVFETDYDDDAPPVCKDDYTDD